MNKKLLILTGIAITMMFSLTENSFAQRRLGNRQRSTVSTDGTTPTRQTGNLPSTNRSANRSKPQPTEAQQQNIQKLEDDLNAIKANSQVTEQQKQDLKNSLYALAEGATKPDKATVDKLATDLSSALADGNFSNQEKAQLANDLETVMNSANIPAEEVEAAITSITAILKSSNISKEDVAVIKTDLQNIAAERKVNRGSRIPKKTT